MAGIIPANQQPDHPHFNPANPAIPRNHARYNPHNPAVALVVPNFPAFQVNPNAPHFVNVAPLWNDPHPQIPGWSTVRHVADQPGAPIDCCWKILIPGVVANPMSGQILGGWVPSDALNLPPVDGADHIFYCYTRNSSTVNRPEEYNAASAIVAGRLLQKLRTPAGTHLQGTIVVILARKQGISAAVPVPAMAPNSRHPILIETMDRLTQLQALPANTRPPVPHIWLISRSMSSFSVAPLVTAWGAFAGKYQQWLNNMSMVYQVEAHWPTPDPPMPPPQEIPWKVDWVYAMKYIWFPFRWFLAGAPMGTPEREYLPRVYAIRIEEFAARNHAFANPLRANQIRFARGNARLQI